MILASSLLAGCLPADGPSPTAEPDSCPSTALPLAAMDPGETPDAEGCLLSGPTARSLLIAGEERER